jgi:hypothetical protein
LKFKLLKNIDGRVKDVKERMNELDIKWEDVGLSDEERGEI